MEKTFGVHHAGPERLESAETKAERLVGEELERRSWSAEDLGRRSKGNREKVKIASRLRQETTMTWNWIAQRLRMGAGAYYANRVRSLRQEQ